MTPARWPGWLLLHDRTPELIENDLPRVRAEKAEREFAKTQTALEVVGRAHALFELLSESTDTDRPSTG